MPGDLTQTLRGLSSVVSDRQHPRHLALGWKVEHHHHRLDHACCSHHSLQVVALRSRWRLGFPYLSGRHTHHQGRYR